MMPVFNKVTILVGSFSLFATLTVASSVHARGIACVADLNSYLEIRDFDTAYFCAGQRLAVNPEDAEANLVFAKSALAIGQPDVAAAFSRKARDENFSNDAMFEALFLEGVAEVQMGNSLAAKLALRQASNYAQSDQQIAAVERAMAAARRASPWSFGLSFSVDPSSNLNSGSRFDTGSVSVLNIAPILPPEAKEQAGIAYRLNADLSHRSALSEGLEWKNRGGISATLYDGFARDEYTVSASSSLEFTPDGTIPRLIRATFALEQRYLADSFGGAAFDDFSPFYHQYSLSADYMWIPDEGEMYGISLAAINRMSDLNSAQDVQIYKLSAFYQFDISDTLGITLNGFGEISESDFYQLAKQSYGVGVSVGWNDTDYPFSAFVDMSYIHDDYTQRFILDQVERLDHDYSLTAGISPRDWQWFGFRPTFGVVYTRQISNLRRYDTVNLGVFTRISSVF